MALGSALALRTGTAVDRFAIGAATLGLLCRYAEEAPVAIVVDDLQWMDRPSVEALTFAARRIDDDPVVVLLAGRPGSCETSSTVFASWSSPGSTSPRRARWCARWRRRRRPMSRSPEPTRYRGNPFADRAWPESRPARRARAGPPARRPRPGRLRRSPAAWVSSTRAPAPRLGPVAVVANGDLLHTRAVCQRLDLDVSGLGQAERAGLVTVAGGRIDVRHPLVRAAIYAEADVSLLRDVHLAVADLLVDEDVERRAWHLAEATWGPDAEVARLLVAAGDCAVARTAYTVASTADERAARLSTDTDDWHARLCLSAASAWTGGLRERAISLLDEVESRPVPPRTRSRTLRIRAQIAAREGSLAEAVQILERAAPDVSSPDETVFLLAEALHAAFYLADAAATVRLGEMLVRCLAENALSPRARAVGLSAAGMAQVVTGRGGIAELRAAVPMLAEHGDPLTHPEALPWLLMTPLFVRDSGTGAELRRLVDEVRSQMGVGLLPNVLFHVARDQVTSNAWPRASANYEEAIRLAREQRSARRPGHVTRWTGLARVSAGPRGCLPGACRRGGPRGTERGIRTGGGGASSRSATSSSRRATRVRLRTPSSTSIAVCRTGGSSTPTSIRAPSWSIPWSASERTRRRQRTPGASQRPLLRRVNHGRRLAHSGRSGWWLPMPTSTHPSSALRRPTRRRATCSRPRAPCWRTAPDCVARTAGSMRVSSFARPWRPSRSSAPSSGPAPRRSSSRRRVRR